MSNKIYDTGKHRWAHNDPIRYDTWNHAPSHFNLGPCPSCGYPTSTYGGGYTCHNDYCQHSANIFACNAGLIPKWWNTDVNVFLDGDMWCAVREGFINLQESIAGFGKTPDMAVANLLGAEKCADETAGAWVEFVPHEGNPVQAGDEVRCKGIPEAGWKPTRYEGLIEPLADTIYRRRVKKGDG